MSIGRIRGVCPRGLIEAMASESLNSKHVREASAGSAPAASLKLALDRMAGIVHESIRGVCPRGLIEARRPASTGGARWRGIRGVCPRGLIEA